MARFLDDIRAAGRFEKPWFIPVSKEPAWSAYASKMWSYLTDPELPVLLIDNVAEYYFTGTDQEYWSLDKDFPNLAPPYPMFWVEHKIVKTIRSKQEGDTDVSRILQNGRVGMLFCSADPKGVQVAGGELPAETRWVVMADLWIDYGKRIAQGPAGAVFFTIDERGALLLAPWMQSYAEPKHEEQMKGSMAWFNPGLLAISFLHCKNVILEDQRPDKALAKRYRERHGVTPTAYKTLVIEPLKQILRREGGSDSNGLQKAMHICRGHFADYREGRGLFGKYKKLVWIPQTLRGTQGTVKPREMEIKL